MDVEEIVKECHRLNIKYTDPLFDLSSEDALAGLGTGAAQLRSRTSVRRVGVSLRNMVCSPIDV